MAKQYEVIGESEVEGHVRGQKFHADLEPAHEARMLRGGFLRVVAVSNVPPEPPKAARRPDVVKVPVEEPPKAARRADVVKAPAADYSEVSEGSNVNNPTEERE